MSRSTAPWADVLRCACCTGESPAEKADEGLTRRAFLRVSGATAMAGSGLCALASGALVREPSAQRPKPAALPLRVQPVFNCHVYEPKPATSWRVTGAIQNEQELREEQQRIQKDLSAMAVGAGFPLEMLPLATVRNVEEATALVQGAAYDVMLVYAARRNVPVLEALCRPEKWNLMFVRHRSGPLYYMYIGAHAHWLRKRRDALAEPSMTVHDIVVDDPAEVLWRLRALYGLKNTLGKRVVAVGGAGGWGADGAGAPDRARQTWKFDIREVSYDELGQRIRQARQNEALLARARAQADQYLQEPGVALRTPRPFVDKAFLLCEVFRDLLDEAQTDTITINSCMSTIMPVSETTACLPLSLLNDEGYLAFCESDFVAIPAGVLLHAISAKPVFLCNPSLPHCGLLAVSHCTAPRRMDGQTLAPVELLTHYESDFGAAPKVEMRKGQAITVLDPDFEGRRWLGFEAEILDSPFYPICRTQIDMQLHGDWQRLLEEIRGFHWLVAYGNHLRELGYAVHKAGLAWLKIA